MGRVRPSGSTWSADVRAPHAPWDQEVGILGRMRRTSTVAVAEAATLYRLAFVLKVSAASFRFFERSKTPQLSPGQSNEQK